MSEAIVDEKLRIVADAAAAAAIAKYQQMIDDNERIKKDKLLRNTKALLENYRSFQACAKNAIISANDIVEKSEKIDSTESILALMWEPYDRSKLVVESIKRSAIKTQIMVAHIDAMFSVYDRMCSLSHRYEDKRRCDILREYYTSKEKPKVEEIAEKYFIDVRTVYADLKKATNEIAKLVFGVDYLLQH